MARGSLGNGLDMTSLNTSDQKNRLEVRGEPIDAFLG